ncbi:hypothetical protein Tco_1215725 [Tanacetum coccineum]
MLFKGISSLCEMLPEHWQASISSVLFLLLVAASGCSCGCPQFLLCRHDVSLSVDLFCPWMFRNIRNRTLVPVLGTWYSICLYHLFQCPRMALMGSFRVDVLHREFSTMYEHFPLQHLGSRGSVHHEQLHRPSGTVPEVWPILAILLHHVLQCSSTPPSVIYYLNWSMVTRM